MIPSCQRIKVNGELCGSPAMRGQPYCYFHLDGAARPQTRARRLRTMELPPLHDLHSIQTALRDVMNAVLQRRITLKLAGQLLHQLHVASAKLLHRPPRGQPLNLHSTKLS